MYLANSLLSNSVKIAGEIRTEISTGVTDLLWKFTVQIAAAGVSKENFIELGSNWVKKNSKNVNLLDHGVSVEYNNSVSLENEDLNKELTDSKNENLLECP